AGEAVPETAGRQRHGVDEVRLHDTRLSAPRAVGEGERGGDRLAEEVRRDGEDSDHVEAVAVGGDAPRLARTPRQPGERGGELRRGRERLDPLEEIGVVAAPGARAPGAPERHEITAGGRAGGVRD